MTKITRLLLICFTLLFQPYIFAATADNSPTGFWKTIDDVTGQPQSILHIWQLSDGSLNGRIVKIWPAPGKSENDVCTACDGDRHNKRIVGMIIMESLKQNSDKQNEWTGGQILDPTKGKFYHCKIKVVDNGQKLKVRGYIGVPLFGRSQTWLRVSGPTLSS